MPFCSQCGKENPEGARFCADCGTAMGQPPSQASRPTMPSVGPLLASLSTNARRRIVYGLIVVVVLFVGWRVYRAFGPSEAMRNAKRLVRAGMHEQAMAAYAQEIAAHPNNAAAHFGAAACALKMGDTHAAQERFASATMLDRGCRARVNSACLEAGKEMLLKEHNPRRAFDIYQLAVQPDVKYYRSAARECFNAGKTMTTAAMDINEVEDYFGAALKLDQSLKPKVADVLFEHARKLQQAGHLDYAVRWAHEAAQLAPDKYGEQARIFEEQRRSERELHPSW